MLKSARRCIVDYRVRQTDFAAAVAHYSALLHRDKPDVLKEQQVAVFKVFTANEERVGKDLTYQAELRVTAVPEGAAQLAHNPAIYWGTEDVEDGYRQLDPAGQLPAEAKEPLQKDPSELYSGLLGSVVDAFGYRVGVATNPDYPGLRNWISLLLVLVASARLLLAVPAG